MAVSVIAILMAIIIPAIGGAQNSAKRAKTRVQFSQWSAAIEQFRQEYGYYPVYADNRVNGGTIGALPAGEHIFHDVLAGRRRNGDPLPTGSGSTATAPERQNPKRISFCSFSGTEISASGRVQDAFGNADIGVVVDRNLSSFISFGTVADDYTVIPSGAVLAGTTGSTLNFPITTETRIRAGVAFYSAGDGQTPVTSW